MLQAILPIKREDVADNADEPDPESGWPSLSGSAPFARDCLLSHYLGSFFLKAKLRSAIR